jgi:amino acid adenylation domain-containing protein
MEKAKIQIQNIYPLSPMQEGMLFHAVAEPSSTAYFEQHTFTIEGTLDVAVFEKSFNKLIQRYEVLRTVFRYTGVEQPVQIVLSSRTAKVHFEDISGRSPREKEAFIESFRESDKKRGFDLTKDLLTRAAIIKTGESTYELIWSSHHILMDGWCMGILMKDFFVIYTAYIAGREPELEKVYPYSDYIQWLTRQDKAKASGYWKTYIEDYEGNTGLPEKERSSDGLPYLLREAGFSLDKAFSGRMNEVARELGVTVNSVFQAAWSVLLHKYTRSADLVFGAVVSGRPPEVTGIENMVGLFINTIPIRVKIGSPLTFGELAKNIQEAATASSRYDYLPLAEIQSLSQQKKDLIDHLVVFENYPVDSGLGSPETGQKQGFTVTGLQSFEQTSYDLNILVGPHDTFYIKFQYNGNVYSSAVISRLCSHLKGLLEAVLGDPSRKIAELCLLSPEEKASLTKLGAGRVQKNEEPDVLALFGKAVKEYPDHVALEAGNIKLTYRELDERAGKLAAYLVARYGVRTGDRVALMLGRSEWLITAILGVIKAGAAYVPVDASYPAERISYMLENSGASVVLSEEGHSLPSQTRNASILMLDREWEKISAFAAEAPQASPGPEDAVYMLYTSGSTGLPKGVLMPHRAMVNLLNWQISRVGFSKGLRTLQFSSISFDVSFQELFSTWLTGGTLVMVEESLRKDIPGLLDFLASRKVERMFLPFAALQPITEYADITGTRDLVLKEVITAGEQLIISASVLAFFEKIKGCRLYNQYGPTETHVITEHVLPEDSRTWSVLPPIGKPVGNTQIYILDENLELVPAGAEGEIYAAGTSLALGYWQNPELTARKFLPNPFGTGRIYRTGDLGKWSESGDILYLGRADSQVKIRGYRVEPGEIETALLNHPGVKEAVVTVKEDNRRSRYLVAYVVSHTGTEASDLRTWLGGQLPEYMTPSHVVFLDTLPLTPSGKINKRALPEPGKDSHAAGKYAAPSGELEEKLSAIWKDLLGLERISVNDSFFDLGGHSLKATLLSARIHKELNLSIPLKEFFKTPTIRGLAGLAKSLRPSKYEPISPAEEKELYPLSAAQRRLYVMSQFGGTTYNLPGAVWLEGRLDEERFRNAFRQLVARHESLRTSFEIVDGIVMQKVHKDPEAAIGLFEVKEEEVFEHVQAFIEPFDLDKAPLLRIRLLRIHPERHLLLLDMHHIISDGFSMDILTREFVSLYQGKSLNELRIQYKDYAEWQNRFFGKEESRLQQRFWMEQLQGELPVLAMPTDFPRPSMPDFRGGAYVFRLDRQLVSDLKGLSGQSGTTMYMLLLAACNVLLHKYTGQEDIIMGTPVSGRVHADLENLIGMFVNTLAMRNRPSGEKKFSSFLQEVRQNSLKAFENQEYPFDTLVEKLGLRRDITHNPLFSTMFFLMSHDGKASAMQELQVSPYPVENNVSKFDLTFQATEFGEDIQLHIEYSLALFKRETIERLASHFINLLKAIVKNPSLRISELQMLSENEREQQLKEFNPSPAALSTHTLTELFGRSVSIDPGKTAVVHRNERLSYGELDFLVACIAEEIRGRTRPGEIVAVMLDRSCTWVATLLGILKAGAVYLPVDPAYPSERVRYMLEDSGAKLLVTEERYETAFSALPGIRVMNVAGLSAPKAAEHQRSSAAVYAETPAENMLPLYGSAPETGYISSGRNPHPDSPAYVIYTSGSTGKPKGVLLKHAGLANMSLGQVKILGISGEDKVLQFASCSFDASLYEIFIAFASAATLVVADKEIIHDRQAFTAYLTENRVSMVTLPPSYLKSLGREELPAVRTIVTAGEPPSVSDVAYYTRQGKRYFNAYGPTETSVCASCFEVKEISPEAASIPIGKPVPGLSLYVLDSYLSLVPVGAQGELCISGIGLAEGYLNQPDLTAEKFVENPFRPGERLYRTGDLCRWTREGNLEFLGRKDEQVKIRGYRIEPGEVQAALVAHPGIKDVAVTTVSVSDSEKELAAYVAGDSGLASELKSYLKGSLPEYMIPAWFVFLDTLPLTPNGKVDREALPLPNEHASGRDGYVAPRSEMEKRLAAIWEEVLDLRPVGVNDNFFDIGGQSLKAITLVSRISKEMGTTIPLMQVFRFPTIAEFAAAYSTDLSSVSSGEAAQSLTLLSRKRERNVFFFPPAAAHAIAYKALAGYIDTHSVYAFNFIESEDRLTQYFTLMQRMQPEGPYTLFAYSAGGVLTFEMAKELERNGMEVSDIIFLDAYSRDRVLELSPQQKYEAVGIHYDDSEITRKYFESEELKQQVKRKVEAYFDYSIGTLSTGSVKADIHLIKATHTEEEAATLPSWKPLTLGRYHEYEGFGSHHDMIYGENLQRNAELVKRVLGRG